MGLKLKAEVVLCVLTLILSMYAIIPRVQSSPEVYGPQADKVVGRFIESPDAHKLALEKADVDAWTDIRMAEDVRDLKDKGYTVLEVPYTMLFYYIAPNLRWHREPWRTDYIPNDDQPFRHALAHLIPKDRIVAEVYGGITGRGIHSVVPEAQAEWYNPALEEEPYKHPYRPGDPTIRPGEPGFDPHSASGILWEAGYEYDETLTNPVTGVVGNWRMPYRDPIPPEWQGQPIPKITFWGVTSAIAPDSNGRDRLCVEAMQGIGLPIEHTEVEFLTLVYSMIYFHDFDMYALGWIIGRFPDSLYAFFHSSQDVPWGYNTAGIRDPELDEQLEIIVFEMDRRKVKEATFRVQEMIAMKLPYIVTVTRPFIGAFAAAGAGAHTNTLRGIINMKGYGQDTGWSFINTYWEGATTGGTVRWIVASGVESYHPAYASTADEWLILGNMFDGSYGVDPWSHADIPWLATRWEIEKWATEEAVKNITAGIGVLGSDWHEAWPIWSQNWNLTGWTDADVSGTLTAGDQVVLTIGRKEVEYGIVDVTWDIKVEEKVYPHNEMKLSLIGAPKPPDEITSDQVVGTWWHELWPTYSNKWLAGAFEDSMIDYVTPGDGVLSKSDQIMLNGTWYHVDSVTITLELDEKPTDGDVDMYVEFVGGPKREERGMKVLFWLRDDVYWHDGVQFNASDIEFALKFLKDHKIARAKPMWEHLVDVDIVAPFKVVVYLERRSLWLFYDVAAWGTVLPRHIYRGTCYAPTTAGDWTSSPCYNHDPEGGLGPNCGDAHCPRLAAGECDPSIFKPWLEPHPGPDMKSGTGDDLTGLYMLIGTGPFVYRGGDLTFPGGYVELTAYRPGASPVTTHWFQSVESIDALLMEMFHWMGDVYPHPAEKDGTIYADFYDEPPDPIATTYDGAINIWDLTVVGRAYGSWYYEPDYNVWADIAPETPTRYNPDCTYHKPDGIVDIRDIFDVARGYGDLQEYP